MHTPRKRFGQHFLHDPLVIRRIIAAFAPRPADNVVEIGPGQGVLTAPLLDELNELHIIELDRDLAALLRDKFRHKSGLHIHQGDALEFDFGCLPASLRIVGKLPYNISTPLLFRLLGLKQQVRDMLFMLQKEVVERLAAGPGSTAYGRLSVMVQYACTVEPLFEVGPGAFKPPPRVDSSVVRLVPHAVPPVHVADADTFAHLVAQVFTQRRKTLRNNLKGVLDEAEIRAAGIDPGVRAETLGLTEFASLAEALRKSVSK